MELTLLLPCLNESETIATCIDKAKQAIHVNSLVAEILIADNGSTDASVELAEGCGARVIHVMEKGYGAALIEGINQAKGKYIIMGDADDSYDFSSIQPFVDKLREGYELVMGNRFRGGIEKNAMPFLHRYVGNPVLSFVGRLFYNVPIFDFHCGLRGFNKQSILKLGLCLPGMEFASEMVVKSALNQLSITEIPTRLYNDGRTRPPHLRTWQDGWRHLRFLLMFCPKWLFLYPGLALMVVGGTLSIALLGGPLHIHQVTFDVHTLLYTTSMVVIGFQTVSFYLFSTINAMDKGFLKKSAGVLKIVGFFSLEKSLLIGLLSIVVGLFLSIKSIQVWDYASFGDLNPSVILRWVIPAVGMLIVGTQLIFNSFYLNILCQKSTKQA